MKEVHSGNQVATTITQFQESPQIYNCLDLSAKSVTASQINLLAQILSSKEASLQTLFIGDNNMGDDGAAALADLLLVNKTITWLDIEQNNISSKGIELIAKALQNHPVLSVIYAKNNKIGDVGAVHIAEYLGGNKKINAIYLEDNNIGELGKLALLHGFHNRLGIVSLFSLQSSGEDIDELVIKFSTFAAGDIPPLPDTPEGGETIYHEIIQSQDSQRPPKDGDLTVKWHTEPSDLTDLLKEDMPVIGDPASRLSEGSAGWEMVDKDANE